MARKSSSGSWEKFAVFWISQRLATSRYASIKSWVRQDGEAGKRYLQSFCYIYLPCRPRVSASVSSIRPCRPRHSCLPHRLRSFRTGTPASFDLLFLSNPIRARRISLSLPLRRCSNKPHTPVTLPSPTCLSLDKRGFSSFL